MINFEGDFQVSEPQILKCYFAHTGSLQNVSGEQRLWEFVMTRSQREIQERINSPAHQWLPFSLRHMTAVEQSTH